SYLFLLLGKSFFCESANWRIFFCESNFVPFDFVSGANTLIGELFIFYCEYANLTSFRSTSSRVPICEYANLQICKYANLRMGKSALFPKQHNALFFIFIVKERYLSTNHLLNFRNDAFGIFGINFRTADIDFNHTAVDPFGVIP